MRGGPHWAAPLALDCRGAERACGCLVGRHGASFIERCGECGRRSFGAGCDVALVVAAVALRYPSPGLALEGLECAPQHPGALDGAGGRRGRGEAGEAVDEDAPSSELRSELECLAVHLLRLL